MQRLGGLDTSFVYLDSPAAPMHVAMVCIFDPHDVPGGYSFEKVRARVAERLHLVAPFRRRLVSMPLHVHRPVWIDDPDFDLDRHLGRTTLPAPGGPLELERFTADIVARPLDRTRPLWEMHLLDGLEGGMVAVVTKMHHATVDGVSAAELAAHLLDLDPDTPAMSVPPPTWQPAPAPSPARLLWDAAFDLARQPSTPRRPSSEPPTDGHASAPIAATPSVPTHRGSRAHREPAPTNPSPKGATSRSRS
jgi:WS/DGAT/MGAT family acyltransferase